MTRLDVAAIEAVWHQTRRSVAEYALAATPDIRGFRPAPSTLRPFPSSMLCGLAAGQPNKTTAAHNRRTVPAALVGHSARPCPYRHNSLPATQWRDALRGGAA